MPKIVRKSLIISFLALSVLISACNKIVDLSEVSYVPDINDVPLPKGFKVNQEYTSFYDSPSGRIIETFAEGKGSKVQILNFYKEALPQLGWQKDPKIRTWDQDLGFIKDEERLLISIKHDNANISIRYSLSPITAE